MRRMEYNNGFAKEGDKKGDFWNRTVVSTVRAAESWDSSPPPAAAAAGGWGIPDSGMYIW